MKKKNNDKKEELLDNSSLTESVEQPAEEKHSDESAVRDITETEKKRLHERFRFDWEIEENLIGALDEDVSELEDEEDDEEETMPMTESAITLAQAAQTVFGLFLLVFTVIGVIATGIKISQVVAAKNDNSAQISHFEEFLMPLVASDAPTFDGAASLNEDVIITAACWDIIFNPSAFYEQSGGTYSVSYIDVDSRIAKLFGAGLTYSHKTVGDTELSFVYNEETGMYSIPAYPRSPAYFPDITAITDVEGGLELTVCYRLPITNWIETADIVEKTMIYTVVPTESDYNVTALRIGDITDSESN